MHTVTTAWGGLTQLAVEYIEFPDGLLLTLDECLEEIRFGGHQ